MITLTKEETALLLAIKGHNLEILPMVEYESYQGYIRRVCGLLPRCDIDERSFAYWVLKLYDKITEGKKYKDLLFSILGINSSSFYYKESLSYILSEIRLCQVKDKLELDESITIIKE